MDWNWKGPFKAAGAILAVYVFLRVLAEIIVGPCTPAG